MKNKALIFRKIKPTAFPDRASYICRNNSLFKKKIIEYKKKDYF